MGAGDEVAQVVRTTVASLFLKLLLAAILEKGAGRLIWNTIDYFPTVKRARLKQQTLLEEIPKYAAGRSVTRWLRGYITVF